MNDFKPFQLAAASVQGRDHALLNTNNQDAYLLHADLHGALLIVSDGCGSGEFSECGAQLGVRLFGAALRHEILFLDHEPATMPAWQEVLDRATQKTVKTLAMIMHRFEPLNVDPHDLFLFTIVGAWLGPQQSMLFACGDGYWALNGTLHTLDPHEGNRPEYLGYALQGLLNPVKTLTALPTADVQSVMVGTDGLVAWPKIADECLPGKQHKVGALEQFWTDMKYVQNADALRRKLALINKTVTHPNWEQRELDKHPGLLKDDTTLAVARRRELP